MNHATFGAPDLTTFARLDELGLEVTGQLISAEEAVLACRGVETDEWCHRRGGQGSPRDTVGRRLGHTRLGPRPTILAVRV
ncbi:ISL3 family transposase, partial [Cutibacterium avidum]